MSTLSSLIFRQVVHLPSSTYTYILGCSKTRSALIIDPVLDRASRDYELISQMNLRLDYTLNTHMHADHVTACKVLKSYNNNIKSIVGGTDPNGDIHIKEGDTVKWGNNLALKVLYTPGHTNNCYSYVLDNNTMCFTGDALLIRGCGRTDFQEGSSEKLYDSIQNKLFKLPDECLVFPGHNYVGELNSTIGEEKLFNPRAKLANSCEEFVEIMEKVCKSLRKPKFIEYCVENNLKGGIMEHSIPIHE